VWFARFISDPALDGYFLLLLLPSNPKLKLLELSK